MLSRNPFVNQVSFFEISRNKLATIILSRNPFVNQVSFFTPSHLEIGYEVELSQSLRKSGQFLYRRMDGVLVG